jgi:hypothetical protein
MCRACRRRQQQQQQQQQRRSIVYRQSQRRSVLRFGRTAHGKSCLCAYAEIDTHPSYAFHLNLNLNPPAPRGTPTQDCTLHSALCPPLITRHSHSDESMSLSHSHTASQLSSSHTPSDHTKHRGESLSACLFVFLVCSRAHHDMLYVAGCDQPHATAHHCTIRKFPRHTPYCAKCAVRCR